MITDEELQSLSFIDTCALRFDGYKYQAACSHRMGPDKVDFPDLVHRIEDTLELYPDQLDNFAVFFALRRRLGKWGGEASPPDDPARVAFQFLFLHLYRQEVPEQFKHIEMHWFAEWRALYQPERERLAAYVRRRFNLTDPEEAFSE